MPKELSPENTFERGVGRSSEILYISMRDRSLSEDEVNHARIMAFKRGEWYRIEDVSWNASGICIVEVPTKKLVVISEDGEVLTCGVDGTTEEEIEDVTVIRAACTIEGQAYTCGMKREVYVRTGEDTWKPMRAPKPKGKEEVGFEAIGGFGKNEIYAAGWNGEIWQYDGKKWHGRDSPTSFILTGLCCAGDGQVYVCGQNGTLVRGRGETWALVDLGVLNDDLWDVRWFNDRLYIATMSSLFEFSKGELELVEFGDDEPATCYKLTDADGVLWSIGRDDIFSFDGEEWTRID